VERTKFDPVGLIFVTTVLKNRLLPGLVGLEGVGRSGQCWAFLVGADMIALMVMFSRPRSMNVIGIFVNNLNKIR
jgi:hypothetical protein